MNTLPNIAFSTVCYIGKASSVCISILALMTLVNFAIKNFNENNNINSALNMFTAVFILLVVKKLICPYDIICFFIGIYTIYNLFFKDCISITLTLSGE